MNLEMIAVHTNHFQVSGNGTQTSSSTLEMEYGDYYDIVEKYRRDQNTYVGLEILLNGLPENIVNELRLLGGCVEWSETSYTDTWETEEFITVYNLMGEIIFEDFNIYQK